MFTILLCKILSLIGRALGRGSSLPGAVALKLDKNILRKLNIPGTVIAVTGSNGKTSTTELIRAAAESTGKRVICNSEGSNQIEGVATLLLRHSGLDKTVQADIILLESDERFCQHTFAHFAPDYILVTNLYRDQTTRNGSREFVFGELKKGLPEGSRLVLCADEPLSALLGDGREDTLWFSVTAPQLREAPGAFHAADDGARCPRCHGVMEYGYRVEGVLGDYRCLSCGYARPRPSHAVNAIADDGALILDGAQAVTPQLINTMFACNIAAAYTVAVEALGLEPDVAAAVLTGRTLSNKLLNRVDHFDISGHPGTFLLCKHENAAAYNGALRTLLCGEGDATLVLIVDLLSRKYVANDMSWLWDIDFETLADSRVQKIVIGGRFAHDVALRLLCAGLAEQQLTVRPDLDEMMERLYAEAAGEVYLFTCFTDIAKFNKRLRGETA